jgi:hypothetical protein
LDGDVVPVDAVVADVERSALEAMVTAFKRGLGLHNDRVAIHGRAVDGVERQKS